MIYIYIYVHVHVINIYVGKPGRMATYHIYTHTYMHTYYSGRNRSLQELWNHRYQQLLEYKRQFGHPHVPKHFSQRRPDGTPGDGGERGGVSRSGGAGDWVAHLGDWVAHQRRKYEKNRLSAEHITLLRDAGADTKLNPKS
jgi:hypothetical protein